MSDEPDTTDVVKPVYRRYRLFTNGEMPWVDRLAIIMEVFKEMDCDNNERLAALQYVTDYHGFGLHSKRS